MLAALAARHLQPVQFLFDAVKGVVADLVSGAHREDGFPCRSERTPVQLAMGGRRLVRCYRGVREMGCEFLTNRGGAAPAPARAM